MSKTNVANTDKYKVIFTNIPLKSTNTSPPDMEVFHSYVKSIILPDYTIETQQSNIGNIVQNTPIQRFNSDLGQLTIEFFVDEDFENYKTFFDWMNEIRRGCATAGKTSIVTSNISQVIVQVLDNENRTTNKLMFDNCFLIALSSLTMAFGSSDELIFSCTFQFDDFNITKTTETLNN